MEKIIERLKEIKWQYVACTNYIKETFAKAQTDRQLAVKLGMVMLEQAALALEFKSLFSIADKPEEFVEFNNSVENSPVIFVDGKVDFISNFSEFLEKAKNTKING